MKKVRRFEDTRRKKKNRLAEKDLGRLRSESMVLEELVDWWLG